MGYRRALLVRWSRRDRLAVLVVALTVAFLTGTALVVLAVGTSTAGIAADLDGVGTATHYDSVAVAQTAAGPGDVVLPLAEVTVDGARTTVVGVPEGASLPAEADVSLRAGEGTTLATLSEPASHRLVGASRAVPVSVSPRVARSSPFPADWYVSDVTTAERLGPTGALVVGPAATVPEAGVPLRGVLAFFLAGTAEALAALTVAAFVGGTLVAVTTYSVTRMTVRDRLDAIRVLRSTGATPGTIRRLFAARAGLQLGIAVALGYALGTILTTVAVTVAVAVGLPTSLSIRVTGRALRVLLPVYGGVLVVGVGAALLAVHPAVTRAPARLGETPNRGGGWLPAPLRPSLLDTRALVPTAATLTALVTFLLVVASLGSVAAPLAASEGAVVTEPGSTHPVASRVPAEYAEVFRERGIAASPEILLFSVRDGQPFPARGANYTAFASVTDARLVRGERPTSRHDAVIGEDLAETLGVAPGDTLLLGGSVRPAVTRVAVVGVFDAPGSHDDQLVVPLATARDLHSMGPEQVQFIRAERLPEVRGQEGSGVGVVEVQPPAVVAAGRPAEVRVTLRNDGLSRETFETTASLGEDTAPIRVTLGPAQQQTVTVSLQADEPGEARLAVANTSKPIRVRPADAILLESVTAEAPPGSEPLVRVRGVDGAPVSGAVVQVGNRTMRTDADGTVRVPLIEPGPTTVTATRANRSANATIQVREGAPRALTTDLAVRPSQPSVVTRPEATITVQNPWNRTLNRTLTTSGPGTSETRTVSLAAGARTPYAVPFSRQSPGTYEVTVAAGGRTLAETTYRVRGDDRIAAALATSGRSGSTGVGEAAAVAFGNLELALGALVVLGLLMAVGGTGATFAQAVHARRQTVGISRATGATPRQIALEVLGDAIRLGVVASALALVLGTLALVAFGELGLLTVYGVRVSTTPDPLVLVGVAVGAVTVTLVGAGVAVAGLLAASPASLLSGVSGGVPDE
jgi:ABC-type lipoprotein release transport system permease subunit